MATGTRSDPVRILWRRVLLAVVCAAALFAAVSAFGVYRKERESAVLRHQVEVRVAELGARHEKLAASVALLKTESGKEKVLRDSYDVGKSGEHLVVIVEPTAPPPTATTTPWYMRLKWW